MPAAVRSYLTAGVALMGAGVITAAQIVPPLDEAETRVLEAAVSLAAAVEAAQPCSGYFTDGCDILATPSYSPVALDQSGSMANIPANLLNAVISIPRAFVDAVNDLSYSLEVTGNWWVYTPTNVLGFDPADPPKATALANLAIPFKPVSNAVGDHFAWWARANLPMNGGCTGSVGPACADPAAILSKMFLAPSWALNAGYQFPELYNPVSDAEAEIGEEIPGSEGQAAPWSGAYVKLDPADPVNAMLNYLMAAPATNTPKTITLTEISATLDRFGKALDLAFNPFVPRSFLLKGWPYTALTPLFLPFVPALCPTCDPDNPGGPARPPQQPAGATILASTTEVESVAPSTVVDSTEAAADVTLSAPAAAAHKAGGVVNVGKTRDRAIPAPAAAEPVTSSVVRGQDDSGDDLAEESFADDSLADESLAAESLADESLADESLAAETEAAPVAEEPGSERVTKQRRGQSRDSAADSPRGSSPRAAATESGEQAGE
jgi:hypothetical protein